MKTLRNLVDYVVRMLQDPVDKSPSSTRHAAFILILGAVVVAIIGAVIGHEVAASVSGLSGGGAFTFFSRTKAAADT